jgi:sigma-E factor negative regulatory protein RseC
MKNSDNPGTIHHTGVVQKVDNKTVTVIITAVSACSGCHAEGSCTLSGKEEKIVDVAGTYNVKPGDSVTVLMDLSMGYTALVLGYIFPLATVILSLLILISARVPELIAGLASLTFLIPYYIILWLFRKRINEKFTFTLKV